MNTTYGNINQTAKRINDPVHGTISLNALELDIIETKVFQRLHNVRQLGLAHHIFPGANYSRFAHSLGACHIISKFISSIRQNTANRKTITDEQEAYYRAAALLHDIGHYPFSHATEIAAEEFYKSDAFLEDGTDDEAKLDSSRKLSSSYNHEAVGVHIIRLDKEIESVFQKHGLKVKQMEAVFSKSDPDYLSTLISSDLDCDRLDYLNRTSMTAGLPYGSVDINYLIEQATLDNNNQFCFKYNGLKASDHLLLSRYFDYQQVPYNKTTVASEILLTSILEKLFEEKVLDCSAKGVTEKIKTGTWKNFDDQHVIETFKKHAESNKSARDLETKSLVNNINCLISRRFPKLICSHEEFIEKSSNSHKDFDNAYAELKKDISKKLSIPEAHIRIWKPKLFSLSKTGQTGVDSQDYDGDPEAIRILLNKRSKSSTTSKTLDCFKESVIGQLAEKEYSNIRLYLFQDKDPAVTKKNTEKARAIADEFFNS